MIVEMHECSGSGKDNDLFELLSKYKNIQKLLLDADKGIIDIRFMEVAVIWNKQAHWFSLYGEDVADRRKWINKMSKEIPYDKRCIPNDYMRIKCDIFESELFIYIDG